MVVVLRQQSLQRIQFRFTQSRSDPIHERAEHEVGLAEPPPPRPEGDAPQSLFQTCVDIGHKLPCPVEIVRSALKQRAAARRA